MAATTDEKVLQRLDQILRVLAIQVGEGLSVTERARLLKVAGPDNQTISEVLNTTPATVRTLTSNLGRKSAAKRRKPLA